MIHSKIKYYKCVHLIQFQIKVYFIKKQEGEKFFLDVNKKDTLKQKIPAKRPGFFKKELTILFKKKHFLCLSKIRCTNSINISAA